MSPSAASSQISRLQSFFEGPPVRINNLSARICEAWGLLETLWGFETSTRELWTLDGLFVQPVENQGACLSHEGEYIRSTWWVLWGLPMSMVDLTRIWCVRAYDFELFLVLGKNQIWKTNPSLLLKRWGGLLGWKYNTDKGVGCLWLSNWWFALVSGSILRHPCEVWSSQPMLTTCPSLIQYKSRDNQTTF